MCKRASCDSPPADTPPHVHWRTALVLRHAPPERRGGGGGGNRDDVCLNAHRQRTHNKTKNNFVPKSLLIQAALYGVELRNSVCMCDCLLEGYATAHTYP